MQYCMLLDNTVKQHCQLSFQRVAVHIGRYHFKQKPKTIKLHSAANRPISISIICEAQSAGHVVLFVNIYPQYEAL